jgi:hypothetical protein
MEEKMSYEPMVFKDIKYREVDGVPVSDVSVLVRGKEISESYRLGANGDISSILQVGPEDAAVIAIEQILKTHFGVDVRSAEWRRDRGELGSEETPTFAWAKLIRIGDDPKEYFGRAHYHGKFPYHEAYVAAINEMLSDRIFSDLEREVG